MDYTALSDEELVLKCVQGSDEAWKEFDRRFRVRPIGSSAIAVCRKWGKNPQEHVQDLVNETYIKLLGNNCAPLVRFRFNPHNGNAFPSWLWTVAASVSHDFFRRQCKVPFVELDEAGDHPQRGYGDPETTEMVLFFDDVDRILRQRGDGPVQRKERTIFWLYYRQRLTCKEVASIQAFHLSIEGVESVIHRLTKYVRGSFLSNAGD